MAVKMKKGQRAVIAAERRQKAIDLRKAGLTYDEIGKQLGVSGVAAYKMVKKVLDTIAAETKEDAEELVRLELERLDFYLKSLEGKIRSGDHKAVNAAIKISERRSRLTGMDTPVKVALSAEEAAAQLRKMLSSD